MICKVLENEIVKSWQLSGGSVKGNLCTRCLWEEELTTPTTPRHARVIGVVAIMPYIIHVEERVQCHNDYSGITERFLISSCMDKSKFL